ncbi:MULTISPECIES: DUF1566 domain-containing protein [Photobacterium]|nr:MULTISPECIES: DUF1566 domain-containing protein [Photobacterium]
MISDQLKLAMIMGMVALSGNAFALECNPNLVASYGESQFIDNYDGTVDDVTNKLRWAKCAVGQKYNKESNSCSGVSEAFHTLKQATSAAIKFGITYPQDDCSNIGDVCWRIPNIKELSTLIERKCYSPAVGEVFKDTPSLPFMTNTPDVSAYDQSFVNDIAFFTDKDGNSEGRLRIINFTDGSEVLTNINMEQIALRMVKKIPD